MSSFDRKPTSTSRATQIRTPHPLRVLCWLVPLALLSTASASSGLDLEWIFFHQGRVFSIELRPGMDLPEATVLADTGFPGSGIGTALTNDGSLYSIVRDYGWNPAYHLVQVNLLTGSLTEQVLPGPCRNLTVGDGGQIWTRSQGGLHRIEADGSLTPTPVSEHPLAAIDSYDGTLYALARPADSIETWLIAADPTTGTSVPVSALEGFNWETCGDLAIGSMAFDSTGGLWVSVYEIVAGCFILPEVRLALIHFPDPETGAPEPRQYFVGSPLDLPGGMAIRGTPVTLEIPTLDRLGLVCLVVALSLLGFMTARIRPR